MPGTILQDTPKQIMGALSPSYTRAEQRKESHKYCDISEANILG